MFLARLANLRVERDSTIASRAGDIIAIMVVRQLPAWCNACGVWCAISCAASRCYHLSAAGTKCLEGEGWRVEGNWEVEGGEKGAGTRSLTLMVSDGGREGGSKGKLISNLSQTDLRESPPECV